MFKSILLAVRSLLVFTVLTGILYPIVITLVSQVAFPSQSNGSLETRNGEVVGSLLIGQSNDDLRYFWPRPSAISYNPLPSSGSNLGPASAALQKQVSDREAAFRSANNIPANVTIPSDMLFASGSGLDPQISPDAAHLQIDRVATARGLDRSKVAALVDQYTEQPQLGILGQPRVNVLLLNLALDQLQ